jgi:hypothetical protein
MLAVKVNPVTDSPGGGPAVKNVPVEVWKYSPLKPRVTAFDTATCG